MEVGIMCKNLVGFSPWGSLLSSVAEKSFEAAKKVNKLARDDWRRVTHSLKVGLTLTFVSVFYYVNSLFDGFGPSAMWALLTVVVVMEYTVGATLGKGLNRAFATLFAGALGVGAHRVASAAAGGIGRRGEPVLLGAFVFVLGSAATFSRFVPGVKKRYDYGVTVFILTFTLVSVTGFRAGEVVRLAHQRLATVALGVAACLCVAVFVFPVWAGEDLHNLVADNLESLANFLEGLGDECFKEKGKKEQQTLMEEHSFFQCYKTVLNNKSKEENLASFASWEPCHGRFLFRHPWKQYLLVGSTARQCAHLMDALAALLFAPVKDVDSSTSDPQQPVDYVGIRSPSVAAELMSSESAKALANVAYAMRHMAWPAAARAHVAAAAAAAVVRGGGADATTQTHIHAAGIESVMVVIVQRVEEVVGSVEDLARLVGFEGGPNTGGGKVAAMEGP